MAKHKVKKLKLLELHGKNLWVGYCICGNFSASAMDKLWVIQTIARHSKDKEKNHG